MEPEESTIFVSTSASASPTLYFFSPSRCVKIKLGCQAFLILILLIFSFPIIIAATLYRSLVSRLGSHLCPGISHILSLQTSPRYTSQSLADDICSNFLLRFKMRGQLDFEGLKTRFSQRFVLAKNPSSNGQLVRPELQQYPFRWAGYDFWKWESKFDINEHIIHQTNDRGGVPFTFANLDQVEQQFLKMSFDSDKSPWKIVLIDDIKQNDQLDGPCFLVWLKIHHTLCDGVSLFKALMECADEKVPALEFPTPPRLKFLPRLLDSITFPFRASYEYVRLQQEKSGGSPWPLVPIDQTPFRSRERHIVRSNPSDKARIKNLGLHYGVSFTAILLASITGGIRNFLLQSGIEACKIPVYIEMVIPVPVENHPEGLSNAICAVTVTLPIGCADIRQRVAICEQSIANRKTSTEPKLTYLLFNLQGILCRLFSIPYKFPDATCSIFPGPLEPVTFCGQELFEMSYVILSLPLAIALTLLTYGDGLQFYCTGDDRVVTQEDVQQLVQCVEDEIGNMEKEMAVVVGVAFKGEVEEIETITGR